MAGDDSDRTRDVACVDVTSEQVSHGLVRRFDEKPPVVILLLKVRLTGATALTYRSTPVSVPSSARNPVAMRTRGCTTENVAYLVGDAIRVSAKSHYEIGPLRRG
jgi:hypothetical protein